MRARNIKPSFFKNPDLADAGPVAQLLFVGLWCMADREGRVKDQPRVIKAELFPYYETDVNRELTVIERLGFIRRYVASGVGVIEVLNFRKHQSPHHTEKPSDLPPYDAASACNERTPEINGETPVKSREQDGGNPSDSLIPDSLNHDLESSKPRRKRRSLIPEDFGLSESMREYALKRYPDMDTAATFADFKDHHTNKGTLGLDWEAGWRTWVNKAERMGYARAKRLEKTAAPSRKISHAEFLELRKQNGLGTVQPGVVGGANVAHSEHDAQLPQARRANA